MSNEELNKILDRIDAKLRAIKFIVYFIIFVLIILLFRL